MKKEKIYTLCLCSQDSMRSVTTFDSLLDAQAVAYAFHLHNEDGGRRWLIIDDSTGTEIPFY